MDEDFSSSGTFNPKTQAVIEVEHPEQCQTSVQDSVTIKSIKNAFAEVAESLKKGLLLQNELSDYMKAKRDSSSGPRDNTSQLKSNNVANLVVETEDINDELIPIKVAWKLYKAGLESSKCRRVGYVSFVDAKRMWNHPVGEFLVLIEDQWAKKIIRGSWQHISGGIHRLSFGQTGRKIVNENQLADLLENFFTI